ncbi:MAG: acetyl-CoA acetyltransferase [Acidimicrobiia bacterium]
MIEPRTPVIVGVGQASQRPTDPDEATEPIDLLARAASAAVTDAGAGRDLAVDTIAIADMLSWRYPDPGALLGRRLGLDPKRTVLSTVGGNSPQLLLNTLAPAIAAGDANVVLLGGAECVYTRWRAKREPRTHLDWTMADDPPCPEVVGDPRAGSSQYEMAHLVVAPTQVYPLFETALRHAAGRSVAEHQIAISELWARFSAVAADNPHAWSRTAYRADEIRTASPDNRMVTFPYPKRMCANIDVDQAAALVLCSYEAARDAGVADDRMVFPLAGADAHDHYFFSERWSLADSPAIAAAGAAALDAAGLGIDDVARFDLYSCFPSAVQIAMRALALAGPGGGDRRPLTVTGGLAYAGGPGNNYATHSIAAMVEACRTDPDSVGLVTALGWYVTKHSVGLYSSRPSNSFTGVDHTSLQARIDRTPAREVAGSYAGAATIEATSVNFERDGTPGHAIVTALAPDGRRVLATSRDPETMQSMTEVAWEGREVTISTDGESNLLEA